MDIMDFITIMDIRDIMDIMDIMNIFDIIDIMIITAWMAMPGAVSAIVYPSRTLGHVVSKYLKR